MTPIGDHKKADQLRQRPVRARRQLVGQLRRRLGLPSPRNARSRHRPLHPRRQRAALGRRDSFDISDDGRFIAYAMNEAGTNRLKLLDTGTRKARAVDRAAGRDVAGGLDVAPWGDVAVAMSSARGASDVYSVDPQDARRHPLDRERDRRARPERQYRARADRDRELRRREGVGLPLPARSRPNSRAAGR